MMDRYEVHNIRWKRTGPRSGWLRRRAWRQRVWRVGTAQELAVATALWVDTPIRWDEAVYLYDGNIAGRRVAARYGQDWKGD